MLHLSPETEFLAKRLAEAQRVTPEEVIRLALEQKAREEGLLGETQARDTTPEAMAAREARTKALVAKFAAMPILDPRSPSEIMDDLHSL